MAQQLTLNLGVIEPPLAITHDPYWDEITYPPTSKFQIGDKVIANHGVTGIIDDIKPWGDILVNSNQGNFWSIAENLAHQQEPELQIGSRIRDTHPIRQYDREGIVIELGDGYCLVNWDNYSPPTTYPYEFLELVEVAHQQTSTCKSVGEQVDNDTAHQHDNSCSPTHFIEIYWVQRGDNKYNYFRYTWMEGRKLRRRYIGSTTSKKAIAKMEMVKSAIALGKLPHEIVEMLR